MPPAAGDPLAELGDFLAALRVSGVPVGPGEIERLRHLFARQPGLDRAGLQALLAALLVKTPAQRQTFDGLFAIWCPDCDADWSPVERASAAAPATPQRAANEPEVRPFAPPPPPPPPDIWQRLLLAATALLLLVALLWASWPPRQPEKIATPAIAVAGTSPPKSQSDIDPDLPDQPVVTFWSWRIADLPPSAIRLPQRLGAGPLALLGAGALGLALALWVRYRRRYPVIVARPHSYRGFGWQPLPPPARDDGALIDVRARRQLVWNIERFVADDPTRRLDLAKTVDESARAGGFMRFCFQPAVFERAIWFWLDRHLSQSTPREVVAQLAATLRAAGLDARQGFFTDLPLQVDWPAQAGYRPLAEEGQGRQAQVVIFSDGAGLRRRLEHPLHRAETRRLLAALQHWPRLCFVDCSPDGEQLAALFAAHRLQLEALALPQLADWLGAARTDAARFGPRADGLSGAARQWAAVVALGGGQADAATAQTLRATLALPADAWDVDRVLAAAAQPAERCRLINWLLRSEPLDAQMLRADSLARRALDWWQARYVAGDDAMRAQENPLLPWRDSLASRRWQVEHAVLHLYTHPQAAAERLSELADAELRDEIRHRLREFAAADHRPVGREDDGTQIHLTWRFAEPPADATTRQRLRQLGFAEGHYREAPPPLQLAPRLVLATALLGSLALAAFAVAAYHLLAEHPPRLLASEAVHEHPTLAAQTLRVVEADGANSYRITLGSPRAAVTRSPIPADAEVALNWRWMESDNAMPSGGDAVVLRAGTLPQPIRACAAGWPQRSLAVVAAPYADPAARQLAIRLLDRGSADQVLVGADWQSVLDEWRGARTALNRNTQILVIVPSARQPAPTRLPVEHAGAWAIVAADDLAAVARAIDFAGAQSVAQAAVPWRVLAAQGEARLYGGPATKTKDGVEWVTICPGSFTMGSLRGEAMAFDNEIIEPARVVTLSGFDIAASETTNRQYAQTVAGHPKRDERPVVGVNWEQARAHCRSMGGDLPSEAQWEYAARGGSRSAWSFGDDPGQLGRHAWFVDNAGDEAPPVKKKRPNPLGLYDMHGNVWEWTRDGYGKYAAGSFVDPEAAKDAGWRVVRGGSFGSSPEDLRSADRGGVEPADRHTVDGFRCVRVPPQP